LLVDAISALAGQPRKARRESKPQPQPNSHIRRHPQVDPRSGSLAVATSKWKIPVAAPAISGKWMIAAAASAMVVGIGILALMKQSSLPVSPADPAVHRARVVIQDYGEHYQLYRGDELLGTTPFEFEANVGERIRMECRSNGKHVQTLTFDVGNNNVWSCRE
jgi:hypothetical protein